MTAETLTADRAKSTFPVFNPPVGGGHVLAAWGKYSVAANVEDGDIFELCKLPPGATVLGGWFWASDMDTGTEALDIDIGWAANGAETADADGFVNAGVLTGDPITDFLAAGNVRPFNMSAGPITFTNETVVQAEANVAAATFAAGTIYVVVFHTVP